MPAPDDAALDALIDAALPHVAFEGWSDLTFRAALRESGVDSAVAATLCPKGAVDLAMAYHRRCDRQMAEELKRRDLSAMKFRDRVKEAVKIRLQIADREAVRRGATLFALPQHTALGARAVWETADTIWTALGDSSDDYNWYTKRASLSGVYSATVLYWLGDESAGQADTWAFLDRRIEDVMRIEEMKARANKNPVLKAALAGPNWLLSKIRPPAKTPRMDVPGVWPPNAPET